MEIAPTTQCLQSIRRGDQQALGDLLNAMRPYVRIIVRSISRGRTGSLADESDLIQESLMQASRCSHTFQGESPVEWLGWLRTVTVRTTRRLLQSPNYRSVPAASAADLGTVIIDSDPNPGVQLVREETADRMALAMTRLPEDMQRVLLARVVDGEEYETIAAELGRSPGAVRVLFVRAVRRLKEIWEAESSSSSGANS
jgi:RNA polymerase sigma-70 factor (ECF subfamily)